MSVRSPRGAHASVPVVIKYDPWEEWFMFAMLALAWFTISAGLLTVVANLITGGDWFQGVRDIGFALMVVMWVPGLWRRQRSVNRLIRGQCQQ